MGAKIGLKCKTYHATAGSFGSTPTWALVSRVRDVSLSQERTEAEIADRDSEDVEVLVGLRNRSIEMELTYDPSKASHTAIREAYEDGTDLPMAFMDDVITVDGAEGLQGNFKVTQWNCEQPLQEGSTVSVTVRPSAESAARPAWVVVEAA